MLFGFNMIDMNMIVEMNPFCDSTDHLNNLESYLKINHRVKKLLVLVTASFLGQCGINSPS